MVKRLAGPIAWAVVAAVLIVAKPQILSVLRLQPDAPGLTAAHRLVLAVFVLSLTMLAVRLLDQVFWRGWLQRHHEGNAPRLLADLGSGAIWVVGLMVAAAHVFGLEVGGMLATSGVAVAVIGFGLRGIISDVASGIAMGLEQPFRIGDWIEVDGVQGRVEQVTWRATTMVDRNHVAICLPNGKLAAGSLRRFGRDGRPSFDVVEATLDFAVSAHQAERLFFAAAAQVPEVAERSERPYLRVGAINAAGVVWRLNYPVADWARASELRTRIQANLLRNLHLAGATLPSTRWQRVDPMEAAPGTDLRRTAEEFLRHIDLFTSLDGEQAAQLADAGRIAIHCRGVPVVRQGEPGESLFVVREGVLEVAVEGGDGMVRSVARLHPGSFFGEMSLLTGAARSATVTPVVDAVLIEIAKDDLEPILRHWPDVARRMSECLAERQMTGVLDGAGDIVDTGGTEQSRTAQDLLSRISAFFGLRRPVVSG